MNTDEHRYDELTHSIVGAVFEVSNSLGCGFPEKVYERALVRELGLRGVRAAAQVSLSVFYKGERVGDYFADLVGRGFGCGGIEVRLSAGEFSEAFAGVEAAGFVIASVRIPGPGATCDRCLHNPD